MQRLLVGSASAASSLRRCPRRQLLVTTHHHVHTRPATPITGPSPYSIRAKLPATPRIQSMAFSTNNDGATSQSQSDTEKSPKKKLGFFGRIRHMLRTVLGTNDDDTPRGIQERKDMYWIVLAVAHRKLRAEQQRKLLKIAHDDDSTDDDGMPTPLAWQEESNEQLKDLMNQAVTHLDEQTDIDQLPLRRLRKEIQSFLEPQIIHLMTVAHDVEEQMDLYHGVEDEDEEDYAFSEKEEKEYKDIMIREYNNVCQSLDNCQNQTDNKQKRTSDPVPFYQIKKGAIETLLTYFDWWPEGSIAPARTTDTDGEEYEDEFGFQPNKSDSEVLPAMRYYHVRNLVRSTLVRQHAPEINDSGGNGNDEQSLCYHSSLPFKSTLSAGRGVFVDGFAPAGTLLSFFPGKVWPKEHLQSASIQTQMQFSANDYRHQLSMRYDDILIDARQSPYTVVKNLWAMGHIVNHPPAPTSTAASPSEKENDISDTDKEENGNSDTETKFDPHQGPNCITVPIDFTDRMLQEHLEKLREYIPNEYELPPKSWAKSAFDKDEIVMHGMGLVALRDVKDEELFYDYRLSPDNEAKKSKGGQLYPSWYYVWDEEAVNNRWNIDES